MMHMPFETARHVTVILARLSLMVPKPSGRNTRMLETFRLTTYISHGFPSPMTLASRSSAIAAAGAVAKTRAPESSFSRNRGDPWISEYSSGAFFSAPFEERREVLQFVYTLVGCRLLHFSRWPRPDSDECSGNQRTDNKPIDAQ